MPSADEFRAELHKQFCRAEEKGASHIVIKAGDLHREIGGYPGDHRLPALCGVMCDEMNPGDEIAYSPPSGQGARLEIRYQLPRRQGYDSR